MVKINKSEELDNYVIKVSINNQIVNTNEISSFMTTDERLQIELFLTLDYNYSVKKEKFIIPLIVLIVACIFKHKKMIIAQIVVLIVFLIFFLLINRKKKKMKL